jgi:hypothetical protein
MHSISLANHPSFQENNGVFNRSYWPSIPEKRGESTLLPGASKPLQESYMECFKLIHVLFNRLA